MVQNISNNNTFFTWLARTNETIILVNSTIPSDNTVSANTITANQITVQGLAQFQANATFSKPVTFSDEVTFSGNTTQSANQTFSGLINTFGGANAYFTANQTIAGSNTDVLSHRMLVTANVQFLGANIEFGGSKPLLKKSNDIDSNTYFSGGIVTAHALASGSVSAVKISSNTTLQPGLFDFPLTHEMFVSRSTNGANSGVIEFGANSIMLRSWDFDPTTPESIQCRIPMKKSWDGGDVKIRLYSSYTGSPTGTVMVWSVRSACLLTTNNINKPWGANTTIIQNAPNANTLYRSGVANVAVPGGATHGELVLEIMRNTAHANDTLNVDTRLHSAKMTINIESENDA